MKLRFRRKTLRWGFVTHTIIVTCKDWKGIYKHKACRPGLCRSLGVAHE